MIMNPTHWFNPKYRDDRSIVTRRTLNMLKLYLADSHSSTGSVGCDVTTHLADSHNSTGPVGCDVTTYLADSHSSTGPEGCDVTTHLADSHSSTMETSLNNLKIAAALTAATMTAMMDSLVC